jgi:hypothetical protein
MTFFSPFVRGKPLVQALPRVRRSEADATSYVADYLTRSVRRASDFVLADYPGMIGKGYPDLRDLPLGGT